MSDECCFDAQAILDDIPAAIAAGTLTQGNSARIGMSREEFAIAAALNPSATYEAGDGCCFDVEAILADIPGAITAGDLTINNASRIGVSRGGFAMIQTLIQSTGGGGGIQSIVSGDGIAVDNTDPLNPIVSGFNPNAPAAIVLPDAGWDLQATWNDGATTFRGLNIQITDTASAAGSTPLRILGGAAGATELMAVEKDGSIKCRSGYIKFEFAGGIWSYGNQILGVDAGGAGINCARSVNVNQGLYIGFYNGGTGQALTSLWEDANGLLAQRSGTQAQGYRAYNTWTSATNFERGIFDWTGVADTLRIGTEKGTTGGALRPMQFVTDGIARMEIGGAGGIGFFGAPPASQPTAAIAAAAFGPGINSPVTDDATFDGYNIGQVVAALRSVGLLA